jgi:hypothetical protein
VVLKLDLIVTSCTPRLLKISNIQLIFLNAHASFGEAKRQIVLLGNIFGEEGDFVSKYNYLQGRKVI